MKGKSYTFTEEQLKTFLSDYFGVTFDDSAEKSCESLLEALAGDGKLMITESSSTGE